MGAPSIAHFKLCCTPPPLPFSRDILVVAGARRWWHQQRRSSSRDSPFWHGCPMGRNHAWQRSCSIWCVGHIPAQ
jgi:hypothetical protein